MATLLLGSAAIPARAAVLVAYDSGVEAFREAFNGVRAAIGPNGIQTVDLHLSGGKSRQGQTLGGDVQAVVAIGSRALAAVQVRKPAVPVIVTMILRPRDTAGISAYLDVELPLGSILAEMRVVLPQYRRVGIVRSPASSPSSEALELAARIEGYTAVVLVCDGPVNLLRTVRSLRGKIDFLLCFPDSALYNSVTIKPLLVAALADRLPVIGFSPAFVHAGAAAGIYADYYEIGRQAGELALRAARGENANGAEVPRLVRAVVNERVARLLGLEFQTGSGTVEVIR
jgi:hypothetical protein